MFELLLGTKRLEGFYPNSGPGPKRLLVGDPTYGVFGVTTDEELGGASRLLTTRLANQAPERKHHNYDNDAWLKMFINGNVYYYPYHPLAFGFTMQDAILARMYGGGGRPIAIAATGAVTVGSTTIYSGPQDFRYSTVDSGRRWVLAAHVMSVDPINRPTNAWSNIANGYEASHIIGLAYGTSTNPIANSPLFTRMARFTDEFGNYAMRVAGLTVYNGDKGELDPGYDIVSNAYSTHAHSSEQGVSGVIQYQSAQEPTYFRPVIKLAANDAAVFEFFPVHSPRGDVDTPYFDQGISSISASDALASITIDNVDVSPNIALHQGVNLEAQSTANVVRVFPPNSGVNNTYSLGLTQAIANVHLVEEDRYENSVTNSFLSEVVGDKPISRATVLETLVDVETTGALFVDSFTIPGVLLMQDPSEISLNGTNTTAFSPAQKPASFFSFAGPILINPTFKKA